MSDAKEPVRVSKLARQLMIAKCRDWQAEQLMALATERYADVAMYASYIAQINVLIGDGPALDAPT